MNIKQAAERVAVAQEVIHSTTSRMLSDFCEPNGHPERIKASKRLGEIANELSGIHFAILYPDQSEKNGTLAIYGSMK